MIKMFVVGISHKTASIEAREQVFLRPLERELLLNTLKNEPSIAEALVISTCNRTEIYIGTAVDAVNKDAVLDLLFKVKKLSPVRELRSLFYCYTDEECLRHLLRVITGLESIVLGEKQILGQVKEAVELSRAKGMFLKRFNVLTDLVVRTGKKAQHETDISCGGGSISWAAVKMAQSIMKTLTDKSVLIIGAGKMSALTADQLRNKQIGQVFIMNRTTEKAKVLAERLGGTSVPFMDIKDVLSSVDLCICSASAPHYLINFELMEKVMEIRRQKELICIDISTPRNIEPRIKRIKNVQLLTIDDLDKVVKENMERRKAAIEQVEEIINHKISEYHVKILSTQNRIRHAGHLLTS